MNVRPIYIVNRIKGHFDCGSHLLRGKEGLTMCKMSLEAVQGNVVSMTIPWAQNCQDREHRTGAAGDQLEDW